MKVKNNKEKGGDGGQNNSGGGWEGCWWVVKSNLFGVVISFGVGFSYGGHGSRFPTGVAYTRAGWVDREDDYIYSSAAALFKNIAGQIPLEAC